MIGWKLFHLFLMVVLLGISGCSDNFYGRIVDQYGHPVSDVSIDFGDCHSQPNHSKTDESGLFSVSLTQSYFFCGIREKEYVALGKYCLFDCDMLGYYKHNLSGLSMASKTTRTSPRVFYAWKLASDERLVPGQVDMSFRDDAYHSLSLSRKRFTGDGIGDDWVDQQEMDGPGDIRIRIRRDGDSKSENQRSWSVELEANNGGLIETKDEFKYHNIPESGYQERWSIEYSKPEGENRFYPGWESQTTRRFYVKARSGKVLSRVEMEIDPFYGNDPAPVVIRIRYWTIYKDAPVADHRSEG